MTSLEVFTFFPDLIQELRDMIWFTIYEPPRCLEVYFPRKFPPETDERGLPHNHQELSFRPYSRRVPIIFHINHESRLVGQRKYLNVSFVSHEIYFDPEDTVYFNECGDVDNLAVQYLANKKLVKYIAHDINILDLDWTDDRGGLKYYRPYVNLKEVTFVGRDEDPRTAELIQEMIHALREASLLEKVPKFKFVKRLKGTENDEIKDNTATALTEVGMAGMGLMVMGMAERGMLGMVMTKMGMMETGMLHRVITEMGMAETGMAETGMTGMVMTEEGTMRIGAVGMAMTEEGMLRMVMTKRGMMRMVTTDRGTIGVGMARMSMTEIGIAGKRMLQMVMTEMGIAGHSEDRHDGDRLDEDRHCGDGHDGDGHNGEEHDGDRHSGEGHVVARHEGHK